MIRNKKASDNRKKGMFSVIIRKIGSSVADRLLFV
jgi:hypothetical protein